MLTKSEGKSPKLYRGSSMDLQHQNSPTIWGWRMMGLMVGLLRPMWDKIVALLIQPGALRIETKRVMLFFTEHNPSSHADHSLAKNIC